MNGEELEAAREYVAVSSKASQLLELTEEFVASAFANSRLTTPGLSDAVHTLSEGGAWHPGVTIMSADNALLAWSLVEYLRANGFDPKFRA